MTRKGPRSVLIIEARFYEDISDELARGAIEDLRAHAARHAEDGRAWLLRGNLHSDRGDLDAALAWARKAVEAINHPIEVRPFRATGRVQG